MDDESNMINVDAPACDACKLDFGGLKTCSRCGSASYCGPSCQKKAWKLHKKVCASLAEKCKLASSQVLQSLETSIRTNNRADLTALGRLDSSGPYKEAKQQGLHELVQQLFAKEVETVSQRWNSGDILDADFGNKLFCNTQVIPCVLFRGDRLSDNFRCDRVDAGRIIDYVSCNPDAFDTWLDASLEVFMVPFVDHLDPSLQQLANVCARDVFNTWCMVFTSHHAAKYILTGTVKEEDFDRAAALDRAKSIGERMKAIFAKVYADDTEFFTNGNIKPLLLQMAAMIHYRLHEYKIEVDFEAMLELSAMAAEMYYMVAVPVAEATIRKGSTLTFQESTQAMAAAAAAFRSGA